MNNSQSYCKDSSKKSKVYTSCFSLYKKPLLGDFIRRFSSKPTTNALVILLEAWCFNNTIIYLQTSATRNGNRWFYVWPRSITKLCFLTQCGLFLHAIIRGVIAHEFRKVIVHCRILNNVLTNTYFIVEYIFNNILQKLKCLTWFIPTTNVYELKPNLNVL